MKALEFKEFKPRMLDLTPAIWIASARAQENRADFVRRIVRDHPDVVAAQKEIDAVKPKAPEKTP